MNMDRRAFNFYASFDEVFQELDIEQKGIMIKSVLDVQFLRVHIDDIVFKDKILSIVWKGMKHSILKQVDGFFKANKKPYSREFFAPKADFNPTTKADFQPAYEQVQGQVQGQVQEKEQGLFIESEFNSIWKKYTLSFIKKMGRSGGSKKKAKEKYIAIRKDFSFDTVSSVVESEMRKTIGHRDLERVLTIDNINQTLEDGETEENSKSIKTHSGNDTKIIGSAIMSGFDPFDTRNYNLHEETYIDAEV